MKSTEIYKVIFKKGETGRLEKKFEGVISEQDYDNIEHGLMIVTTHIMMYRNCPEKIIAQSTPDDFFTIVFEKNAVSEFRVRTGCCVITPEDCENIITGLLEMTMKLHLDRMVRQGIKVNLVRDDKVSPLDFRSADELV